MFNAPREFRVIRLRFDISLSCIPPEVRHTCTIRLGNRFHRVRVGRRSHYNRAVQSRSLLSPR